MATSTKEKDPKTVTIYGRLSFPVFEHARAVERNATSKFKKDDTSKVTPEFHLLVEQGQLDKLTTHLVDHFIPYCIEQGTGERDGLLKKDADKILKQIKSADWDDQPPYVPMKTVNEKTAVMAPEAVASIKVVGNQGVDVELKARVNSEDELLNPTGDIVVFPAIVPLGQSVHQMYPGCYVAATLNLYAYETGGKGITASASVAVFKAEGDRFGGGVAVDEDEMFLDD